MESMKNENWLTIVSTILGFIIGVLILMLLWNSLMPFIFGLPKLNFVQIFGLFTLVRIFIGDFSNHKLENEKNVDVRD